MSNNGIPPLNDWQEDNYPVIYDEGAAKSQYVKSGTKIDIPGGSSSYLVYTALLSQSGTDAPTAEVIQNTIGGDVIWTRLSAGNYLATSTGHFTANRCFLPNWFNYDGGATTYQTISDGGSVVGYYTIYDNGDGNSMYMEVLNSTFNFVDIDDLVNGSVLLINIWVV